MNDTKRILSSFVVLDPKGEIARDTGHLLEQNGYEVRVLDLLNMEKSFCYNPFVYLQSDNDIQRLVTNLFKSTTPKLRVSGGDIKAVQGENGQKDPKMVTHQYSRIIDEDRIRLADAMNDDFYRKDERRTEEDELLKTVKDNPELFKQFMAFMAATGTAKNS